MDAKAQCAVYEEKEMTALTREAVVGDFQPLGASLFHICQPLETPASHARDIQCEPTDVWERFTDFERVMASSGIESRTRSYTNRVRVRPWTPSF